MAGCNGTRSLNEKVIDVQAQYLDLANRSVAIVVSMSDYTEFKHPDAKQMIAEEMTQRIQANVPGVTLTRPSEIIAWQKENAYWATRPPSMLIQQLKVERLVLVEIGEYRTHEPGDMHVLRGVISANINIIEAEAADPDNFGASFTKNVMYPEPGSSKIGRVGEDEKLIEVRTQIRFCESAAGLFYDHQIISGTVAVFAPPEKVNAKYELPDKATLVVIDDPRSLVNSPDTLRRIATATRNVLEVEEVIVVGGFVDQADLAGYREELGDQYNQTSLAALAMRLDAKQVIHAEVTGFQVDLGGNLIRPAISLNVKVFDLDERKRVFPTQSDIDNSVEIGATVYPLQSQMPARDLTGQSATRSIACGESVPAAVLKLSFDSVRFGQRGIQDQHAWLLFGGEALRDAARGVGLRDDQYRLLPAPTGLHRLLAPALTTPKRLMQQAHRVVCWTEGAAAIASTMGCAQVVRRIAETTRCDFAQRIIGHAHADAQASMGSLRQELRQRWGVEPGTKVVALLGDLLTSIDTSAAVMTLALTHEALQAIAPEHADIRLLYHPHAKRRSESALFSEQLDLQHLIFQDAEVLMPWSVLPGCDATLALAPEESGLSILWALALGVPVVMPGESSPGTLPTRSSKPSDLADALTDWATTCAKVPGGV
eukprot:g12012.t1